MNIKVDKNFKQYLIALFLLEISLIGFQQYKACLITLGVYLCILAVFHNYYFPDFEKVFNYNLKKCKLDNYKRVKKITPLVNNDKKVSTKYEESKNKENSVYEPVGDGFKNSI
ncbi:uncharacterized protein YktA (UPF0223 family) [Methanococcus voltae]|uniref:Uncharacterized protein YktA (UPF0223 family) n=1 Tax=Methanococcus voltae TaxID=2188 RepID=A0A8J7RQ01_METVO|nr:hypothetical protein [Methanococcus voltae]MBP2202144.1 uncharacterized protein YktA (UPF0223 family) [Methanococcus voltae]